MSRKWGVGPIMKKLNENVYTKLHELFNKVFYAPTEAELERYPGWRHNLSSWQYLKYDHSWKLQDYGNNLYKNTQLVKINFPTLDINSPVTFTKFLKNFCFYMRIQRKACHMYNKIKLRLCYNLHQPQCAVDYTNDGEAMGKMTSKLPNKINTTRPNRSFDAKEGHLTTTRLRLASQQDYHNGVLNADLIPGFTKGFFVDLNGETIHAFKRARGGVDTHSLPSAGPSEGPSQVYEFPDEYVNDFDGKTEPLETHAALCTICRETEVINVGATNKEETHLKEIQMKRMKYFNLGAPLKEPFDYSLVSPDNPMVAHERAMFDAEKSNDVLLHQKIYDNQLQPFDKTAICSNTYVINPHIYALFLIEYVKRGAFCTFRKNSIQPNSLCKFVMSPILSTMGDATFELHLRGIIISCFVLTFSPILKVERFLNRLRTLKNNQDVLRLFQESEIFSSTSLEYNLFIDSFSKQVPHLCDFQLRLAELFLKSLELMKESLSLSHIFMLFVSCFYLCLADYDKFDKYGAIFFSRFHKFILPHPIFHEYFTEKLCSKDRKISRGEFDAVVFWVFQFHSYALPQISRKKILYRLQDFSDKPSMTSFALWGQGNRCVHPREMCYGIIRKIIDI